MTAKEIYLEIKGEITKGLYAYDDQIVAIAKWVESEFKPKKQGEKLLGIADVIQSLPNGKQIPSDEVLLDFIDWFGTWQTDKRLEDYGINDTLDAYKLHASEERGNVV